MAVQGSHLRDVNVIGAPLQAVSGIPAGALFDVFVLTRPTISGLVGANLNNRFPTPPSAFGFLTEVRDFDDEFPYIPLDRVQALPGGTIIGALNPPGNYLEPTTGQIWPR